MKRFLAIMLSLIMTACFAGCNKAINNQFPNDLVVSTETEHPMITQSPDWPVYNTAAEIVTASSNIYTGKVKNISFEIVNMKTGTADSSAASGKTDCMLYTVYTVDVLKSYKGDNSGEIKICVIGGIAGYRENEQYDALQAAGLYEQYNGILWRLMASICSARQEQPAGMISLSTKRSSHTLSIRRIIPLLPRLSAKRNAEFSIP